jgi:hypothetical protein
VLFCCVVVAAAIYFLWLYEFKKNSQTEENSVSLQAVAAVLSFSFSFWDFFVARYRCMLPMFSIDLWCYVEIPC